MVIDTGQAKGTASHNSLVPPLVKRSARRAGLGVQSTTTLGLWLAGALSHEVALSTVSDIPLFGM